jgi:7-carboxy-7-deazaguanine synthase
VVEKFVSINGEGRRVGQLAIFIRFAGCNLKCDYCDTMWANEPDVKFEPMTGEEIYTYIKSTKVNNVTLTGGEPLLQENIGQLLKLLSEDESLNVEIETNGSVFLGAFACDYKKPPSYTMDYKLPISNMEIHMIHDNFNYLTKKDTIKFVVGTFDDLLKAEILMKSFELIKRTNVYISPVYGELSYDSIVEFMKDKGLNDVTFQLQLHKIIWSPEKRGV